MTIKTALSLPKGQFLQIERLRKTQGISRSAFIQKLIGQWLKNVEEAVLVQRYVKGYKHKPEAIAELKAMAEAAAQSFREEGLK